MQALELWSSPGSTKRKEQVSRNLATAHSEPLSGKSSRAGYRIFVDCYVAPASAYCHIFIVLRRGFLLPRKDPPWASFKVSNRGSPPLGLDKLTPCAAVIPTLKI